MPVPRHAELKRGTLIAIITEAVLTKEKISSLVEIVRHTGARMEVMKERILHC